MLRGGMDGLCAIPVKGDKNFEKLRSKINLDRTLKLTSDFDLHPALKTFKSLWDQNLSAAVHATNIPYTGRSHFDGHQNVIYQYKEYLLHVLQHLNFDPKDF